MLSEIFVNPFKIIRESAIRAFTSKPEPIVDGVSIRRHALESSHQVIFEVEGSQETHTLGCSDYLEVTYPDGQKKLIRVSDFNPEAGHNLRRIKNP